MQVAPAPKRSFLEKTKRNLLLVLGLGFVLYLAGVLIAGAMDFYRTLDRRGWITHNHDTPVWIAGDWMVGEYRDCGMLTATPPAGVVLSQEARAELPRLFCGKQWESVGILEFQFAMPDDTTAKDAIDAFWQGGDWSALDRYFHVLPVRYNGRIDRPDTRVDSWRCQRQGSSLLSSAGITCNALN